MLARLTALLPGILALAALRARHDTLPYDIARLGLSQRLWHLSAQFPVMTGLLAAVAFLAIARGWRVGPRSAGALLVALALAGLTTPSLPAPLWPLFAPLTLAQTGLAIALPLAGFLWWLAFAPKWLTLRDLPLLLAWPLAFGLLSLARGRPFDGGPAPGLSQLLLFSAIALGLSLGVILLARMVSGHSTAPPR